MALSYHKGNEKSVIKSDILHRLLNRVKPVGMRPHTTKGGSYEMKLFS
jgi:hypothetical protein